MSVLSIARLRREISSETVRVLEDAARAALTLKPSCCEHLADGVTAVALAGQPAGTITCARCAFRGHPDLAAGATCRACKAETEDTALIGASFLGQRRGATPSGVTVWLDQVVVMARFCGRHRSRTPVPPAPAEGMWRGERL